MEPESGPMAKGESGARLKAEGAAEGGARG